MTSSTTRAFMAKKQSTSFAHWASKCAFICTFNKNRYYLFFINLLLTLGVANAWGAEPTATLTFDDHAKRTTFTTSQQVWEENGVTFTNDKASSTNSVADYAKPARLYAGSSVTVACSLGNMTQIVFDCNSSSYATAMKNSIGSSATASSDKVTVSLNGTSNTFTVAKLTAQVRLDAITVTYEEGCSNPNITTQPTGATYTQGATATALKVVASGDDLTYQWYSNTSNSTSGATKINGATNSTYTPSTSTVGTKYYYCIVSSGSCSTTSNIVSVVVKNPTYTVIWKSNGEEIRTDNNVESGTNKTAPTISIPCGDVIAGWTDAENYVHGTSTLYSGATPSIQITGNKTFYAVFADYANQ